MSKDELTTVLALLILSSTTYICKVHLIRRRTDLGSLSENADEQLQHFA